MPVKRNISGSEINISVTPSKVHIYFELSIDEMYYVSRKERILNARPEEQTKEFAHHFDENCLLRCHGPTRFKEELTLSLRKTRTFFLSMCIFHRNNQKHLNQNSLIKTKSSVQY